jgi:hypothetical protein
MLFVESQGKPRIFLFLMGELTRTLSILKGEGWKSEAKLNCVFGFEQYKVTSNRSFTSLICVRIVGGVTAVKMTRMSPTYLILRRQANYICCP